MADEPERAARKLVTEVVVDHSRFLIVSDHGEADSDLGGGPPNWLLDSLGGQLSVTTALDRGPKLIPIEFWRRPPTVDYEDWDDIVDIPVFTSLGLIELAEPLEGPAPDAVNLAGGVPGWYRLRVSVRGRDDMVAQRGQELHRLQVWPDTPSRAPEAVRHKLTDSFGTRLRGDTGPLALRPWELSGVLAMRTFISGIAAVSPEEAVTTVRSVAEYRGTRQKMFKQLSELSSLFDSGGFGQIRGTDGASEIYSSPDGAWRLYLEYKNREATSPLRCRWDTRWGRLNAARTNPWPLTQIGIPGTLTVELAWSRPVTTATITHTGIPASCAPALSALWDYWLELKNNRLSANDSPPQPWTKHRP